VERALLLFSYQYVSWATPNRDTTISKLLSSLKLLGPRFFPVLQTNDRHRAHTRPHQNVASIGHATLWPTKQMSLFSTSPRVPTVYSFKMSIFYGSQVLPASYSDRCLFSWRYNPVWLYFHSPVAGFSLLVFEVSWTHTTTRQSVGLLWTSDKSGIPTVTIPIKIYKVKRFKMNVIRSRLLNV
jgi:hypothetical protein